MEPSYTLYSLTPWTATITRNILGIYHTGITERILDIYTIRFDKPYFRRNILQLS